MSRWMGYVLIQKTFLNYVNKWCWFVSTQWFSQSIPFKLKSPAIKREGLATLKALISNWSMTVVDSIFSVITRATVHTATQNVCIGSQFDLYPDMIIIRSLYPYFKTLTDVNSYTAYCSVAKIFNFWKFVYSINPSMCKSKCLIVFFVP